MSRTWLITGSSRGFGLELTRAVLESGDRVLATARRPEQLTDLLAGFGDRGRAAALDVTDPVAARAAVQAAVDAFGALDVVVNNAGYANSAPIEEMDPEDFRAQIEANLFGVVNVTRAALPVLRAQRSGTFVQFSSIGGRVGGTPGMGACQTAKFAVEGFSEVLSNELKPLGIKVTHHRAGRRPRPVRRIREVGRRTQKRRLPGQLEVRRGHFVLWLASAPWSWLRELIASLV